MTATHLWSTPGQQQRNDRHHLALLFWCTTCIHPELHSSKNFQICVFLSRVQARRQGLCGPLVPQFTMEMSGVGELSVASGLHLLFCSSLLPLSCKLLKLSRCPAPGRYTAGRLLLKYCFPWSAYFVWMQTEHSLQGKNNSKELLKSKIKWETALNKSAEQKSQVQRAWRVVPRTLVTHSIQLNHLPNPTRPGHTPLPPPFSSAFLCIADPRYGDKTSPSGSFQQLSTSLLE